jgi:hypothetical protein
MLRRCAGQSHFCVHGGAIGVRWERNLQETLFPPIELVEAREGCAEGVRGSSRYSEGQIYGERMKVW